MRESSGAAQHLLGGDTECVAATQRCGARRGWARRAHALLTDHISFGRNWVTPEDHQLAFVTLHLSVAFLGTLDDDVCSKWGLVNEGIAKELIYCIWVMGAMKCVCLVCHLFGVGIQHRGLPLGRQAGSGQSVLPAAFTEDEFLETSERVGKSGAFLTHRKGRREEYFSPFSCRDIP